MFDLCVEIRTSIGDWYLLYHLHWFSQNLSWLWTQHWMSHRHLELLNKNWYWPRVSQLDIGYSEIYNSSMKSMDSWQSTIFPLFYGVIETLCGVFLQFAPEALQWRRSDQKYHHKWIDIWQFFILDLQQHPRLTEIIAAYAILRVPQFSRLTYATTRHP